MPNVGHPQITDIDWIIVKRIYCRYNDLVRAMHEQHVAKKLLNCRFDVGDELNPLHAAMCNLTNRRDPMFLKTDPTFMKTVLAAMEHHHDEVQAWVHMYEVPDHVLDLLDEWKLIIAQFSQRCERYVRD